ncbi:MAG: prepilin-type N-terminal cleavage/methylation domain-containing protein [Spartobacteria bacterium]
MKILSILSKKSSAFSLLEVLVAISVLSILLVVLLNIVQNATSLWRRSESKVEAYREARAAIQVINADMKNILATTNMHFFRTNLTNSQNLGFLATLPSTFQNTNSLSDVCTVGYFRAYENKSPVVGSSGRQSYNLYRYFVESNETFTNLQSNPSQALTQSFDTNHFEILARNVISFSASYFITNASGTLTPWTQSAATPTPHLVEITLTAVNNERTMRFDPRSSASQWDSFATNTNSADYLQNTKTFRTRIPINTP